MFLIVVFAISGCSLRTTRIAHLSLRYVPYASISNEWVLLTYCFVRSGSYGMFLMLVFEMSGCSLRTAYCVVVFEMSGYSLRIAYCAVVRLTLCFVKFLFQMKGSSWRTAFSTVLLTLCSLCVSLKCVGAPFAQLRAQCSLRYVPYASFSSNEWVLLTYCFVRSGSYAMFLILVYEMSGCSLRTAHCAVVLTSLRRV
jgi:hypothetical protein